MQKINSEAILRDAILQLEKKQADEGELLKEQFHAAYESIKPINLVKSTFKEVTTSPELKDEILNTAIGITAGYFSKILFQGASHSPMRKLFGTVLMFGITNAVAKHPEVIKSVGNGLFKMIIGKGDKTAHSTQRK